MLTYTNADREGTGSPFPFYGFYQFEIGEHNC